MLIAGRILQWRCHRIERERGEPYPRAVLRVIAGLDAEARDALRETVRFLLDTDLRYGPFESLARYQRRAGSGAADSSHGKLP